MIVAVTSALDDIAGQLRRLGYEVVAYGKYEYPIDALVYTGENILSSAFINSAASGWGAVLMVNA